MRFFKTFAIVTMLAISASASAQFTTSTTSRGTSDAAIPEGWQTFYVQWNPSTAVSDKKNTDDQPFTAFTVGYNKAFGITQGTPLFIEAGLGLQYTFRSEDGNLFNEDDDDNSWFETNVNVFSAKVPVNLTYCWQVSPTVALQPFAGLTGRFNIAGTLKRKITDDESYEARYADDDFEDSKNIFDKKDIGKDNVVNRFQLGWQVGINARFNKSLLLGVSYGSDFSEFQKKVTMNTTSITLGYCF